MTGHKRQASKEPKSGARVGTGIHWPGMELDAGFELAPGRAGPLQRWNEPRASPTQQVQPAEAQGRRARAWLPRERARALSYGAEPASGRRGGACPCREGRGYAGMGVSRGSAAPIGA